MTGDPSALDAWEVGARYEAYVGRWSRAVAREFVRILRTSGGRWLDVGCGGGALVQAILEQAVPESVVALDRSLGFLRYARTRAGAAFHAADAQALPFSSGRFDAVVSGLVLNFVGDPGKMVEEMVRVARPGATVALYVWDYAGRMEMIRHFWSAAMALDPGAAALDEAARFPICAPGPLRALFEAAGVSRVTVGAIDVPTVFRDFDDYWMPFLGGQGPAPGYVASLGKGRQIALRERVRSALSHASDGSIPLRARAFSVHGIKVDATREQSPRGPASQEGDGPIRR
ncbi:MAG TPA: methyltransferase domain-containing protein [Anaeromyxobacter sp.]|nr:methyltransferase domain-containing protein [Anaeromyxobacter sp.]